MGGFSTKVLQSGGLIVLHTCAAAQYRIYLLVVDVTDGYFLTALWLNYLMGTAPVSGASAFRCGCKVNCPNTVSFTLFG